MRFHVIIHEWLVLFMRVLWISTEVMYVQRWYGRCHVKLMPSQSVLCTPYNHAPCHFMQSHLRMVYACYSCNLPPAPLAEWPDLLRATAVARGWNGYRNKKQHRKLTVVFFFSFFFLFFFSFYRSLRRKPVLCRKAALRCISFRLPKGVIATWLSTGQNWRLMLSCIGIPAADVLLSCCW